MIPLSLSPLLSNPFRAYSTSALPTRHRISLSDTFSRARPFANRCKSRVLEVIAKQSLPIDVWGQFIKIGRIDKALRQFYLAVMDVLLNCGEHLGRSMRRLNIDLRCQFPSYVLQCLPSRFDDSFLRNGKVVSTNLAAQEMQSYIPNDLVELPATAIHSYEMIAKGIVAARVRIFTLTQLRFIRRAGSKKGLLDIFILGRVVLVPSETIYGQIIEVSTRHWFDAQ